MIEERTERFAEGIVRGFNERDWETYRGLFAERLIMRVPGVQGVTTGREARLQFVKGIVAAFPDGQVEVRRSFGQGDWGCAELHFAGTHTGPLATPDGGEIAPTNKPVQFPYCVVAKLEDGKATELYEYFDQLDMLTQMGVI